MRPAIDPEFFAAVREQLPREWLVRLEDHDSHIGVGIKCGGKRRAVLYAPGDDETPKDAAKRIWAALGGEIFAA